MCCWVLFFVTFIKTNIFQLIYSEHSCDFLVTKQHVYILSSANQMLKKEEDRCSFMPKLNAETQAWWSSWHSSRTTHPTGSSAHSSLLYLVCNYNVCIALKIGAYEQENSRQGMSSQVPMHHCLSKGIKVLSCQLLMFFLMGMIRS